jgi:hypothetical protein
MKKLFLLFSAGLILFTANAGAIGLTDIGFKVGLATPNKNINDVYNKDLLDVDRNNQDTVASWLRESADLGYFIGINLRFSLKDNIQFTGGLGLNRFPETESAVTHPSNPSDTILILSETTNIVPVSVGVNYYLVRSFLGLYALGELQYNYIMSNVDVNYVKENINFPMEPTPSYNRIGAAIGAGIDLDIQVLTLNLEAKYNISNLNQSEGEESKNYLNVTLGVYF